MKIYPIVMCGGAGTRLWPASRPSRPKQFIPLSGNRSLFQDAVLRTVPLAGSGGQLIVIGGEPHRALIVDQLSEIDVDARVLLEPEPRDSAPAIAAAVAHVLTIDPDAIVALVASDHHIPADEAFRQAITEAAREAQKGQIVTLGVKPTHPSTGYGYIRPAARGMSRVEAFIEKPDQKRAIACIAQGYLWNSGNFIASAQILDRELRQLAPAVHASAVRALAGTNDRVRVLSDDFRTAPRVSIDYAVMEKTKRASVLEVDFDWSDLGTWEAMSASGEGDVGLNVFEDVENCLTRAPDGVLVAAIGVRNLAIVVEPDAVLVADLSQSVNLKRLIERVAATSPKHLDHAPVEKKTFAREAEAFARWLRLRALPLWSTIGLEESGAFAETMSLDGVPLASFRRARVQARQIYVFAQAGILGWDGPWRAAVQSGLVELERSFRLPGGLYRARVDAAGRALDDTVTLYDQAFAMLALATAHRAGVASDVESEAATVRDTLLALASENGAMVEVGDHPHQANAHMHLFEAFQAWEDVSEERSWAQASDQIAGLAKSVLFDDQRACLREFYSADWTPAKGEDGRLVEPGHQFEWASLLFQYGLKRGDGTFCAMARRLHAFGRRGIADQGGYVLDALNEDGTIRSRRARLWPQSEWLRASLLMAEHSTKEERVGLLSEAESALSSLFHYLTPDGLWNDKQLEPGDFLQEPAPASSFYHIMSAFSQLEATSRSPGFESWGSLKLGGSLG